MPKGATVIGEDTATAVAPLQVQAEEGLVLQARRPTPRPLHEASWLSRSRLPTAIRRKTTTMTQGLATLTRRP